MIAAVTSSNIRDRKKFADECLHLLRIMRNDGTKVAEWIMVDMEEKAKGLIIEIEAEDLERSKVAEGGPSEQKRDEVVSKSDGQTEGNADMPWLVEVLYRTLEDAEITKWMIEGMYGTASSSKASEGTASGKHNPSMYIIPCGNGLMTPPS
jgi:hypothetical protein